MGQYAITNRDWGKVQDINYWEYSVEELRALGEAAKNGELINYHDTELDDMAQYVRCCPDDSAVNRVFSHIDDKIRELEELWNEYYVNNPALYE